MGEPATTTVTLDQLQTIQRGLGTNDDPEADEAKAEVQALIDQWHAENPPAE